jgi:predicted phosphodiesterase
MKIFAFSDSHLYNKYDESFYQWVKDVDKVIICGDFWDKYVCSYDKFIDSKWKDTLFPLLKSKNTHYIYGNHDKKEYQDDRVELFSDTQSEELDIELDRKIFHFEHGDRFGTPIDGSWWPFLVALGYWIQVVVVKIKFLGKRFFELFKDQVENIKTIWGNEDRFLICGHSHYGAKGDNFYILNPSAFGLEYGLIIDDNDLLEIKGFNIEKMQLPKEE